MELRSVGVKVCWWVIQMVSGSWVGKYLLQANSQPSRRSSVSAGLQATCSRQLGYCCTSLAMMSQEWILLFYHNVSIY